MGPLRSGLAREIPAKGYAPIVIFLAFTVCVQMLMLNILCEYPVARTRRDAKIPSVRLLQALGNGEALAPKALPITHMARTASRWLLREIGR